MVIAGSYSPISYTCDHNMTDGDGATTGVTKWARFAPNKVRVSMVSVTYA